MRWRWLRVRRVGVHMFQWEYVQPDVWGQLRPRVFQHEELRRLMRRGVHRHVFERGSVRLRSGGELSRDLQQF